MRRREINKMKICTNNNNEDRCNFWCHNGCYCHATDEQLLIDCHVYQALNVCQECRYMQRCKDFISEIEDEPEIETFAKYMKEMK